MTGWAERLAERSPAVQRSRDRSMKQAQVLVDAGRRLATEQGASFTIQDLVKEAGVALQTFYRYFPGKDELLLAVLEDLIVQACDGFRVRAEHLADPVERLRSHVVAVVQLLDALPEGDPGSRFVPSEHWRLAEVFPEEVDQVSRPYTELLRVEIEAATQAGSLRSVDPERDAWLLGQLVISVFHQRSFLGAADPGLADAVWRFCLHGLGAPATEPVGAAGTGSATRRRRSPQQRSR